MKHNILFIVKNNHEASSRFRIFVYYDLLIKDFNIDFFYSEYNNKNMPKLLRSLIRRINYFKIIFKLNKYDKVIMQRPMSSDKSKSTIFEWLVSKFSKELIFDYDDALFLVNEFKIKSILKIANKIICSNQFLKNYSSQYNKNIFIIPTVVDTNKFIPINNKDTNKKIVIGWTGTSGNYQFFTDHLIEIINRVLLTYKNTEFLFICDKKPPNNFTFKYSYLKWNEKTELQDLQKIDIGLMPLIKNKWTEGKAGFKTIQYGSIGIPSIASDVGVTNLVIENNKTGFLISNLDDEISWQNKLEMLIANKKLREEMGQKAREKISREYSAEVNYPKLKDAIEFQYLP